ncbi:MAG: IS630 family transposase [Candidatus Limnocylindria bacterium]
MREGIEFEVSAADRARLEAIVADRDSPQKHVWRAQIILATAEGCGTAAVMRRAGVSKPSVWRWQERFMSDGVDGLLHDKTRPARIPPLPKALVEAVVTRTLDEAPPGEVTHWTAPAMAAAIGLGVSSVQRIWRAHGLRPHQVRRFKLSTDPKSAEKVEEIVGLYVDPPAHAVVLSIDEKLPWLPGPTLVVGPEREEIQALDRTQPGLPMKKGRAGTMTHDYKRHGTTTLSAALNVLDGSVIGRCMQRHRHQELIRFLNDIERTVPAGKPVHVVLDNYGAHKQANVRHWLARHPRWIFHFTPTSCSWLNAVETFFAKLTSRRLQRGVFHSLVALQTAINRFVETHNQNPKRFVWKADPNAIVAAAKRGYQALDSIH